MSSKYKLKTQPTDKDPLQVISMIPSEKKASGCKNLT